jgi:hypothetical protein
MDILEIRKQINALPDGPYLPGLRAVLSHLEVAERSNCRGNDTVVLRRFAMRTNGKVLRL